MPSTTKVKQRSKSITTASAVVEAVVVEAVSEPLSPAEKTRAKRVAALVAARAAKKAKATRVKRQANAAKARKAKATRAKRVAALEKARATKAQLAEFSASQLSKKDLVSFIESQGHKRALFNWFYNPEAE